MKEIRTYMSFNFPVDPAKIETLPDVDLCYALGSTLDGGMPTSGSHQGSRRAKSRVRKSTNSPFRKMQNGLMDDRDRARG